MTLPALYHEWDTHNETPLASEPRLSTFRPAPKAMQYVRNLSDSVSTAWNSINPATLSGAIDVIVVEQEDGTLSCSPFHVRFGKFSLLRPYEKKVEFRVNGKKQDYAMKLGEGGEAFFVFETSDTIPQSLQTSPLVSPASSPPLQPSTPGRAATMPPALQEPPLLDLEDLDAEGDIEKLASASLTRPGPGPIYSSSVPREKGWLPLFYRGRSARMLSKLTCFQEYFHL